MIQHQLILSLRNFHWPIRVRYRLPFSGIMDFAMDSRNRVLPMKITIVLFHNA